MSDESAGDIPSDLAHCRVGVHDDRSGGIVEVPSCRGGDGASAPLCFAPINAGPGLAARANADRLKELCESAARRQGVPVVPFESPSCAIAATMDWSSKPTGEIVEDCTTLMGINCTGAMVHGKTLRVSLNQKSSGKQMAESVSMIQSDFASITDHTVFALCSAAFYRYPVALKNEQFSVPVGD